MKGESSTLEKLQGRPTQEVSFDVHDVSTRTLYMTNITAAVNDTKALRAPLTSEKPMEQSLAEAKSAHFWAVAFPGIRLLVLSLMFLFFGIIQSARAYTVIGSVFGAFIFSLAGVSFWVGCQSVSEAYASAHENFPDDVKGKNGKESRDMDVILARITASRIVDDKFVEYRMDVSAGGKQWFVWRRYSDFVKAFQQDSDFAKSIAKAKLPPKRWMGNHLGATFIEERTNQLNQYLGDLLKEHGGRRADSAFVGFFGL